MKETTGFAVDDLYSLIASPKYIPIATNEYKKPMNNIAIAGYLQYLHIIIIK